MLMKIANMSLIFKISLVMLDLEIPDQYKEIIKKYSKFFSYNKYIYPFSNLNIESYIDCDTFTVLDELIIGRVEEWIKNESVNQQGLAVKIEAVINSRIKVIFHHYFIMNISA